MKVLTTLFMIGMFTTAVAMADDVDDVKAAVKRYIVALNGGDANAYVQSRMPEYSVFAGGELIDRSHSLEEQRNGFQSRIDSGIRINRQLRHLEVKVYGNAAIVTGYMMGTTTGPDGTVNQLSNQRTGVWIKQGGQWKEAHRHGSPLVSSNEPQFQTKQLPADYDYLAPDGSEIRLLPTMNGGGLAHDTLPPGKVSAAVRHQTVEEIWYFTEGEGEVWRKQGEKEEVVSVRSGVSITIPIGTHFQFRNTGERALEFLISTMPPWPGATEAIEVKGKW